MSKDNMFDSFIDTNQDGILDSQALDTDDNGAIDTYLVDRDQDGYVDAEIVDTNSDGYIDMEVLDTDGDGNFDTQVIDTNIDGVYDTQLVDTNSDGLLDTQLVDSNADGVIDTQLVDSNGDGVLDAQLIDTDGDNVVDTQLVDSNGDGVLDTQLVDTDRDGIIDTEVFDSNGDGILDTQLVDTNEDGIIDTQLVDVNQDGVIDTQLVDVNQDGVVDTEFVDTNGDGIIDSKVNNSDNFVDPIDNNTDYDLIAGTPEEDMENWHMQNHEDTCAVVSQEFILDEITGKDFTEDELMNLAIENGWYTPGGGTTFEDVGKILEAYGVNVERTTGNTLEDLESKLESGEKIIVGVDSSEIWSNGPDELLDELLSDATGVPDQTPDHAVQVIGIDKSDPNNPVVILNDPGHPDGMGMRVPADEFFEAWEDSDCYMVSTVGCGNNCA